MKLVDLQPKFITYSYPVMSVSKAVGDLATWVARGRPCVRSQEPREVKTIVPTLAEAQGIFFECPKCMNGHLVEVTFRDRGVPDHLGTHNKRGEPVRWEVSGSDFADLTTRPSILLEGGCCWHGFVTNGEAN